ncbi:MAG: ATP-binding cassette domain-containing protein [Peptoniphilaceae bacterium]|nr:ATP-binding cassette domain-containing protein [Peptoniphilaceae bacterium]MDY6019474.1 ATP-binding cassette domain-containing protein [Anaerococcus sp.]
MENNSKIIVEVKELEKKYDSFNLKIPNLEISEGEFVGIVGENGAGKTTLIRLILNLTEKNSGFVKLFNNKILDDEVKKKIGFVSEQCAFSGLLTVEDINRILKNIYKANWQQDKFFNNIKKHSLPLNKNLDNFSTGMKAKLCLFAALAHSPKLLILDESTSNLDPIIRRDINLELKSYSKKTGCTIIFSSHLVSELEEVCDRIIFIDG